MFDIELKATPQNAKKLLRFIKAHDPFDDEGKQLLQLANQHDIEKYTWDENLQQVFEYLDVFDGRVILDCNWPVYEAVFKWAKFRNKFPLLIITEDSTTVELLAALAHKEFQQNISVIHVTSNNSNFSWMEDFNEENNIFVVHLNTLIENSELLYKVRPAYIFVPSIIHVSLQTLDCSQRLLLNLSKETKSITYVCDISNVIPHPPSLNSTVSIFLNINEKRVIPLYDPLPLSANGLFSKTTSNYKNIRGINIFLELPDYSDERRDEILIKRENQIRLFEQRHENSIDDILDAVCSRNFSKLDVAPQMLINALSELYYSRYFAGIKDEVIFSYIENFVMNSEKYVIVMHKEAKDTKPSYWPRQPFEKKISPQGYVLGLADMNAIDYEKIDYLFVLALPFDCKLYEKIVYNCIKNDVIIVNVMILEELEKKILTKICPFADRIIWFKDEESNITNI